MDQVLSSTRLSEDWQVWMLEIFQEAQTLYSFLKIILNLFDILTPWTVLCPYLVKRELLGGKEGDLLLRVVKEDLDRGLPTSALRNSWD